jgi:protein-S-isoprenylcysteine O-methyltransferase Ste14
VNALELKVPPLVLVLVLAGAMWFAAIQLPSLAITLPWRHGLAVVISGVGILFILAGIYAFRKAKTTVNPTKPAAASTVVTSGVYRFSRNPMYVGFLLALIGWATVLSHTLPFLFLPVYVAYINRFQISPEEGALSAKFGDEYEAYKQAVRRWL